MARRIRLFITIGVVFMLFKGVAAEDTLKNELRIGGGVDVYYGYNLRNAKQKDMPYYVSMARNNEININLAYLDLKYESEKVKFSFVPAIGTYMNANYALEPGLLKLPVEANCGVRLAEKRNVWLEAGIFSSPYTNETPFSKDHLMYSRSLAPEYVPYYITGARVSSQLTNKLKLGVFVINGWQQTIDLNNGKSVGTSLEYKLGDRATLYWNTYLGDERSVFRPEFRMRYFSDVYFTFLQDRKWSLTSCIYGGLQEVTGTASGNELRSWWQANLIGRYTLGNKHAISSRIEYFSDPSAIQIVPVTEATGFRCLAYSVGYAIPVQSHAMIRFEFKNLVSDGGSLFLDQKNNVISSMPLIYLNLTAWF